MERYEFDSGVCCDFISPKLDNNDFKMIAVYEVDADGDIDIDHVQYKPSPLMSLNHEKLGFAMARYINELKDFDHLIDRLQSFEDEARENDF